MKLCSFYIVLLLSLISCTFQERRRGVLPILDLSCDYPIKKVNLYDIAEVEYIPLETTDSSLLTQFTASFFVSNEYILTSDMISGDIFIFSREGKFLRKFNHMGNGANEYIQLNLVVDFEAEECFVYDKPRDKFMIYSFKGEFIRSFSFDGKNIDYHPLYNYDKDYLIGHNCFYTYETKRCEDKHPFHLVSKKDGTKIPLELEIHNRISNILNSEIVDLGGGQAYLDQPFLTIFPLLKNGSDFLIAEYALDTLYSFTSGKLIPIAKQIPSVFSVDPPIIIAPNLYTDSIIQFRAIPMYYDASDSSKPFYDAPVLIWNRHTNQVEKWEIYNPDYGTDVWYDELPNTWIEYPNDKNMGISFFHAEKLLKRYKEGKLSGELLEIVPGLKEDDNYILEIVKYK